MRKKLTSLVASSALVVCLCGSSVIASSYDDTKSKNAERVKAGITKIGTGQAARVEIKLRDKTKLRGYIDQISEDHFIVINDKTGTANTVSYPQVKQVKGNNLSTGAKIAIGFGLGVLFVLWVIAVANGGP